MAIASQSAVWDAATRLRRDGLDVSVRKVREEIGGGSMNDISAHLNAWRNSSNTGDNTQDRHTLLGMVNKLYDDLVARVEADLVARETALNDKITSYERYKESIHVALTRQESEIADLKAQLAKRDIVEADLRKELDIVCQHRGEAQTELRLTKQALADQTSTHEKALKELKEANAESLREQQKVVHRAQADQEQLLGEQARLTASNAQLTTDLEQAKQVAGQQTSNHRTELDKLSVELNALLEKEAATRQQCEALASDLPVSRKESAGLKEQYEKARDQVDRLNDQLKALHVERDRERTTLSAQLEDVVKQSSGLEQRIIQLTAERDILKTVVEQIRLKSEK